MRRVYWCMVGGEVSTEEGEEDGRVVRSMGYVERSEERGVAHLLVASLSDDSCWQAQTDAETEKVG